MNELDAAIEHAAVDPGFSGVVRVDVGGEMQIAKAFGLAHRGHQIANTVDTRFGVASAVKGMTALVVVSLIEEGALHLSTTARSLLGDDLPLIDDAVTIEQLLAHRSGIGDYLDEDLDGEVTDYIMTRPVHELVVTDDYLPMLEGFPQEFPPGERFKYNNGAFVVLALIAERASGVPYHDLVDQRVCRPADMIDTAFLRSDLQPGRAATGYLTMDGETRTNILHLPVRGNGDGGAYSTVSDIHSLWAALFAGRIVSTDWVAEMVRPLSDAPAESKRYGLGFWLHETTDAVILEGYDAGVSFRSTHDPTTATTFTVIANNSEDAWPMTRLIAGMLSA